MQCHYSVLLQTQPSLCFPLVMFLCLSFYDLKWVLFLQIKFNFLSSCSSALVPKSTGEIKIYTKDNDEPQLFVFSPTSEVDDIMLTMP